MAINAPAPELDLPGVDGKTYRLEDFADARVLVVVFTCNHCPTAQAYEERIMRLHADYRDRGVALVAISPNDPQAVRLDELGYTDIGDSFEEWSTTCAPCITELAEFVTVNRMYRRRNFEMITLTTDPPDRRDAARKVLRAQHVSCTNYIFDSDDRDRLADALDPHWEGPVPYTILIAPGGKIVWRWKDTIDPARLKAEIVQRLGRTYSGSK